MNNSLEKNSDEHLSGVGEGAEKEVSFENFEDIVEPVFNTLSKMDYLKLTTVVLKGVGLSSLPDVPFINVVKFDLSDNNLSFIPLSFSWLKKLETFNVSRNQFVSVPHCLAQGFISLKHLFLSENQIVDVRSMNCLSSIQLLDLSNNEIDSFPECLVSRFCVRLEELDISRNFCFKYETEKGIDELRDILNTSRVTNISQSLKKLTLSNCDVTETFSEILELFPNLIELNLSNGEKLFSNDLNFFPKMPISSMMRMQNLSVLKLANVSLRDLTDQIAEFKNLKALDLKNNHLKWLHDSFCDLRNLEFCDLSNNELYLLPDKIGNLSNLSVLFLPSNALSELPESLGQMENLKYLDLYYNQISEIPEVFSNLNLEGLDVENNHFESSSLPNSMGYLKLLDELRSKYQLDRVLGHRPIAECKINYEIDYSSDSTPPSSLKSLVDIPNCDSIPLEEVWDTEVEDEDDLFNPYNFTFNLVIPEAEPLSRRKPFRASPPVEGQFEDAYSE